MSLGTVTVIDALVRKDQLPSGPVLPVVEANQVLCNVPVNKWGVGYPPQILVTQQDVDDYLGTLLATLLKGSTPTIPTTYTSTKSYTATCGSGTTGNPVTRSATRTSTLSQADADAQALQAATTLAQGALVCTPVRTTYTSTQSYTTTPQDYTTKCGSGTSGNSVTHSSTKTSTVSQAQADQLALQDATAQAIAAITCPVAPPSYNTTLTTSTQTADGMSFVPPTTEVLKFNLISGTSGPTISIAIKSQGATSYVDYASEYAGQGYAYFNNQGIRYDGVFPSADNLNINY